MTKTARDYEKKLVPTIREQLTDELKTAFPQWRIENSEVAIDVTDKTVLLVRQYTIEKATEAPQGVYRFTYRLDLISPLQDVSKAETQLDDDVTDLIFALDNIPYVAWKTAQKTAYGEPMSNLSYTLDLSVLSSRTIKETE